MALANFMLPLSSDPVINSLILWDWQRPSPWPADGSIDYVIMQSNLHASVLPGSNVPAGFVPMSSAQIAATNTIMAHVSQVVGVPVAMASSGDLTADIYFGTADYADNIAGMAYYMTGMSPSVVYLDNSNVFDSSLSTPVAGTSGYEVLLHEIGHALGLDHPFEAPHALPAGTDNTSLTVMSYTDVGGPYSTFREWDVKALQYLYNVVSAATTTLTDGDDARSMTEAADIVFAGAGNDTVSGLGGNDILYGNTGNDVLYGNLGDDTLYGGQDADILFGGQGADQVYGNMGDDLMYGNLEADLMFGGQGNDTLFGGQGNDTLYGNLGDDVLYGNLGADTFDMSGGGNDRVMDFLLGTDRLAGITATSSVVLGSEGVVIAWGGANTVTLVGVTDVSGVQAHLA